MRATESAMPASASARTAWTVSAAWFRLPASALAASTASRASCVLSGWLAADWRAAWKAESRAAGAVASSVSPTVCASFVRPVSSASLRAASAEAASVRA